MLRREHQGGKAGMVSADGTSASTDATIMLSTSNSGLETDLGGRQERRCTKKDRKRRERNENRSE